VTAPSVAQRREWAARLRATGFRDIEGPGGMLATDVRDDTARAEDGMAVGEYYRLALAFLHQRRRRFGRVERKIWALHAAGRSYTQIAAELRSLGVYRRVVAEVVPRLRAEMLEHARVALHTRPRGRPPVPSGYHRGSYLLQVRLTDAEAEALHAVARRLNCEPHEAARACIRFCVDTNSRNDRAGA
jgi:hypothetical protein